jgi:hypothetical protein
MISKSTTKKLLTPAQREAVQSLVQIQIKEIERNRQKLAKLPSNQFNVIECASQEDLSELTTVAGTIDYFIKII